MNEHSIVSFRIKCCNIYTQRHGPLHHNGMHVLRALCMGGSLLDGMEVGKDVNTQVSFPFHKEEYNLHRALLSYSDLMQKISSEGHDKSLYNNDCHKEGDSHTNCHRQIARDLNKPSFFLLQSVGQHKISKQAPDMEDMKFQVLLHSGNCVSFSLVSV